MKLITAIDASELLNIRVQRLYELVRQRAIPYVKLGSWQLRFDLEELTAWVKRGGADGKEALASEESDHESDQ